MLALHTALNLNALHEYWHKNCDPWLGHMSNKADCTASTNDVQIYDLRHLDYSPTSVLVWHTMAKKTHFTVFATQNLVHVNEGPSFVAC